MAGRRFKRTAIVAAAAAAALAGTGTVMALAADVPGYTVTINDVRCVGTNRAEVTVFTSGRRAEGLELFWRTVWTESNGTVGKRTGTPAWVDSIQTFRISLRNDADLSVYIQQEGRNDEDFHSKGILATAHDFDLPGCS